VARTIAGRGQYELGFKIEYSRVKSKRPLIERILAAAVIFAAGSVLTAYHFFGPFPNLGLAFVAAVVVAVVTTTAVQSMVRGVLHRRYQAGRRPRSSRSGQFNAATPEKAGYEEIFGPLRSTPAEVDLLVVAHTLRFLGSISAVVCLPITVRWCVIRMPSVAGWVMLLAAVLTAAQVIAFFAAARHLNAGHAWARRLATVLLVLELPAFPLTLFAVQALYLLYRARLRLRAAVNPETV
jgi:hypothetical protein